MVMYGYIYKTTNLINGKIYIGKHKAPKFDPRYKGSGTSYLQNAFHKYGWENFKVEFLIPCFSLEELNAEEEFLIDWFNARDRSVGYNRAKGGDGGDITSYMTPEEHENWRKKISEAHKGEKHHFYGKHFSEEHKQKLRKSQLGKEVSDETRERLRISHLGSTWTEESKAKMKRTRSDPEFKERMSEIYKNRTYHKTCVVCGKDFVSRGSKAKYCSDKCRYEDSVVDPASTELRALRYDFHHSEESKRKISQALSGTNNPFYGKHHSEESKIKMREASEKRRSDPNYSDPRLGTKRSEDTRRKISEARKNSKFRVRCKQCGNEFLANSPNKYQLCESCKEVIS